MPPMVDQQIRLIETLGEVFAPFQKFSNKNRDQDSIILYDVPPI